MLTTPLPRRLVGATAVTTVVLLVHSLVWLLRPDLNPYANGQLSLLSQVLPLSAFTTGLSGLALIGTVCATIAALVPHRSGPAKVAAPVVAVGLVVATSSMSGLSFAGYLVALVLPFAAVVAAVVAMVRAPRTRIPFGALLVAATVIAVIFHDVLLTAATFALIAMINSGGMIWVLALTLTATGLWVATTAQAARTSSIGRAATELVVRLRVPFTLLAAAGPLPYAVIRLSWLTPWPVGGHPSGDPAVTAWGLLLSLGAWMGAILTIGLIRPWGERFPAWMPAIGGRTVNPLVAIIPGGIVAGLVCLAAVPWISRAGPLQEYFWILPVWLWGPMLTLAVWGYAGHRAAGRTAADSVNRPGTQQGPRHRSEAPTR